MKYTSTLRQNIKIAKNPHELYLIGCLQELDFNSKEHPKEHFSALDRFSDWSIDYKLLKKAFPVERDLRNFIDDFMYQFKGHTKNSIPWEKYPDLEIKYFKIIPNKAKSKETTIKYIKSKKNIYKPDYSRIPKSVLKNSNIALRLVLSKVHIQSGTYISSGFELVSMIFADTYEGNEEVWTENKFKFFLMWIENRHDRNIFNSVYAKDFSKQSPIWGFNSFPEKAKKSIAVRRAMLPKIKSLVTFKKKYTKLEIKENLLHNLESHSDFFTSLDKNFLLSLSFSEADDIQAIASNLNSNRVYIDTLMFAFIKKWSQKRKDMWNVQARKKLQDLSKSYLKKLENFIEKKIHSDFRKS
tara:strand:- start:453 stop:1517 length:1065 start_codon:yes stop_codon:yes gene_type:complete